MNELLDKFLTDCAAAPGVMGCGVRLPDRTSHVRSGHPDCSAEAMERTILHLANATSLLAGHELAAQRLTWTFSQGRIYVAIRPDGAIFSLVSRADANTIEFFDRMTLQFFNV